MYDAEEQGHPYDTSDGEDVPFTTKDIPKMVDGIERLMLRPAPRPTIGLAELMAGTNKPRPPVEIPEDLDLSRFDETLRNTLR